MKSRYTTFDIKVTIKELQSRLIGLRVVNVYDVDNKTYLIKLAKPDEKAVLLLESGIRLHSTEFEWPKNSMPSGFAMKMRKHLKSRRLEKIEQLGIDRIVDMQFGSSEAAYHIILELYDRGNIVLTDHEYLILNILRPRTDESQDVRYAVRETYPCGAAKQHQGQPTQEWLSSLFSSSSAGDNLKKVLNPHLVYGPAIIDHCLLSVGLPLNARIGKEFNIESDIDRLMDAIKLAESIMFEISQSDNKGYIVQQREKKPIISGEDEDSKDLLTYSEFHPMLFKQYELQPYVEWPSFDKAVDEFFSKIESQKMDVKVLQQERAALKKLENVKKDHLKRLEGLEQDQALDVSKAQLIEINLPLVDRAITVIRSALANQISWADIQDMVNETAQQGDSVATAIKTLKLDSNHMTMLLKYPSDSEDDDSESESMTENKAILKPMKVDIDLGLSAYANARKYFDMKRHAANKEQKTISAGMKALKSAEQKTRQMLKEVKTIATINKARKTYWFEKFLWFISSENYLVIGGRDQQQNEMIVKRHLNPGDIYVHADLHGASSIVIKNPSREPVPPKTLNEAGTMALCNSAAWDAKVVTSSWWVYHDQVSKTAPTGEYLTTGSFMIRGKKNYLPPSYLIYGFGFLFKADESSVFRHKNERRIRTIEDDASFIEESASDVVSSVTSNAINGDENNADQVHDSDHSSSSSDSSTDDEGEGEGEEKEKSFQGPMLDLGIRGATEADIHLVEGTVVRFEDINDVKTSQTSLLTPTGKPRSVALETSMTVSATKSETTITSSVTAVKTPPALEFPDTNIQLHHVKGDKFTLQRDNRIADALSLLNAEDDEEKDDGKIYLGDDTPVVIGAKVKVNRVSAKQRRLMKKSKNHEPSEGDELQHQEESEAAKIKPDAETRQDAPVKKEKAPPPPQLKRGQKSKLKKIRELYGDQDEEERQLKMELLASAKGPKEEKTKKGGKGGKQKVQLPKKKPETKSTGPQQIKLDPTNIYSDETHSSLPAIRETATTNNSEITTADVKVVDEEDEEGQEEENNQAMQTTDILDSLTGLPVVDDILLFCLPVCAPYAALNNYKYKVKIVPGTTKRGKAAKMAVNMFISDKMTTPREKDLFKSLKDTDLSRNMPGKVKVSHPNLHKSKQKS